MKELYHNPDPLYRLIGEPNEAAVIVENQRIKGLIDSGAQVSSISDKFAEKLNLEVKKLETLLDLEPTGGGQVPYDGYVEVRLQIPNVKAFDLNVLMLVIPESEYSKSVPVTIGTIHIDEIINLITDEELRLANKKWQRGIISRKVAIKSLQLKENKDVLDKVTGDVKLTRNVQIPPMETITVSGITTVNSHTKRVNVITEPRENLDEYTVHSYSYMRLGSKRVSVALRNLSEKVQIIKKGTTVASIKAANLIPPKLAPKYINENNNNNKETQKLTPGRAEKLFSKLDLEGAEKWSPEVQTKLNQVFKDYHHIFALDDLELGRTDMVKHVIKLDNKIPFRERYRRIPPHQYEEVKNHLKEMLEIGAIRKSQSPWASAVVLVRKKDGALRFCIDLRKLNARTIKDAQTLPRIEESLDSLCGAVIFTSLDLKSGYWQVELDEDSVPYTAFTVGPLGFYECLRMPFGLTNAPATFQRLMENCLGDLHLNWCIIYLDDIINYSKTPEEHVERLEAVFQKLSAAGLKLKPSKCEFFKSQITYLGHIVSSEGIATDPKKIKAIQLWPRPETVTQIRKFTGLTNYYRKFIHNYAKVARLLHQLVSGENAKLKRATVKWTEECERSFLELKDLCSNTPVLAYPDYTRNFKLYTDASESGLGAVLTQVSKDKKERPVAYASRTLSKSERNYDAHKLEFLALKWSITDRFHEYLYGGTFDVYTDNNPLTYILTSAKLDAIGQRWVASLGPYNFSLHYNPGRQNTVADSLSRIPWENVVFQDEVDYNIVKAMVHKGEMNSTSNIEPELLFDDCKIYMKQLVSSLAGKMTKTQWQKEQLQDAEIGPVLRLIMEKRHLQYKVRSVDNAGTKIILRFRDQLKLVEGLLYRKWMYKKEVVYLQFVLPKTYRKKTVMACHDEFGHLGMDKTLVLLQERFFWPRMNEDIRTHIRSCEHCLRFKRKPEKEEMSSFETSYPWEIVHMDFLVIGSKKNPDKDINVLVVTDHFTRYAQAFVTTSQTAAVVAQTLYKEYFVHYGWPDKLHSDQAGNFESKVVAELCKIAQVQKIRTTPYNPKGNAQCEKFNQMLLSMIGTLEPGDKAKWQQWVPTLTHAYNCTRCESAGFSPYYLMYGRLPRLPIDIEYGVTQPELIDKSRQSYARKLHARLNWAFKMAKDINEKESQRQKRYYDRSMRCQKLVIGDVVLVKEKGSSGNYKINDKWELNPYTVMEHMQDKDGNPTPVYHLKENVKNGAPREKVLHRNMLYPFRSVQQTESPLLAKANILMDIYFDER